MSGPHDQTGYGVRLEWGLVGASRLAPGVDLAVVVDVLSFSTAVGGDRPGQPVAGLDAWGRCPGSAGQALARRIGNLRPARGRRCGGGREVPAQPKGGGAARIRGRLGAAGGGGGAVAAALEDLGRDDLSEETRAAAALVPRRGDDGGFTAG